MDVKRVCVRMYDENLERRLNEYYEKTKRLFKSKNDFLATCFDYGLTMLENSNKLNVEEFLKSKDFVLNQKINQAILSDIYKILEAFNDDTKIDEDYLGKMEGLPAKFWLLKRKIEKGGD